MMALRRLSRSCAEGLPASAGGSTRTGGMRILSFSCRRGSGAAPVHTHLALADAAVHGAARQPPQALLNVVIEPLAGLVQAHLEVLYLGADLVWIGLRQGVLSVRHCFYNGLSSILCGLSAKRTHQWLAAVAAAGFSWTSESRPSHWADKIAPPASNLANRDFRSRRRRLSSPKVSFLHRLR